MGHTCGDEHPRGTTRRKYLVDSVGTRRQAPFYLLREVFRLEIRNNKLPDGVMRSHAVCGSVLTPEAALARHLLGKLPIRA